MQYLPTELHDKRILVAALDWGMGHTTRCVALIRLLQAGNNVVIFAGNEFQCAFMCREFPEMKCVQLSGYDIRLDSKKSTYIQVLTQLRKLCRAVNAEEKAAASLAKSENIDLLISDNRYGFHVQGIPNILLTHQLNLQLPRFQKLINSRLHSWIEKFDQVWIPDRMENPLCGELTNASLKIPCQRIGLLSRFYPEEKPIRYDLLGIVSGPEPERSRFANLLNNYLQNQNKRVALVGISGNSPGIDYFENPATEELQDLINSSVSIISRAGYTTLMELIHLHKKALLIPTPGQYEQVYLASAVHEPGIEFESEQTFLQRKLA